VLARGAEPDQVSSFPAKTGDPIADAFLCIRRRGSNILSQLLQSSALVGTQILQIGIDRFWTHNFCGEQIWTDTDLRQQEPADDCEKKKDKAKECH